jgi:hypothetical protein
VLSSLLQLPATVVPAAERTKWSTLLEIVPPIPMTNATPPAIAPGEKLPPKTSNVENPELYTLHPYRVYSAAKGVPEAALLAYRNKRFSSDDGWCQVAPDAALAGRLCSQPICSFAFRLLPRPYPLVLPHYMPSIVRWRCGGLCDALTIVVVAPTAGLGNRSAKDEAPALVLARAAMAPAAGYRFPAFMSVALPTTPVLS